VRYMFEKVFIIAEASSNHNGDIETALKLVRKAREAGADAVKFQDYALETLFCPDHYERVLGLKNSSWRDDIHRLTFGAGWHQAVAEEAARVGIWYFSTPFSLDAVESLDQFVPFFKISSGDITFIPLLEKIGQKRKGVFISSGASFISEIDLAVSTLRRYDLPFICVMHCIMAYPAPLAELNLNFIDILKTRYGIPVGFSDHSPGSDAAIVAVGKGVQAIEKHFTLDKNQQGADHKNSLDPGEFANLVQRVRSAESMLGPNKRKIGTREKRERIYARRGIYSKVPMKRGEVITLKKVSFLRPNVSIGAERIGDVLGKRVTRDLGPYTPLDTSMFG